MHMGWEIKPSQILRSLIDLPTYLPKVRYLGIRGINNMEWLNRNNEFSDHDLKLLQFHPEQLARCAIETIRLQKGENVSVLVSNRLPLFVATDVGNRGYRSLIPNLTEPKGNFGAG